jgi:hypothetical protein
LVLDFRRVLVVQRRVQERSVGTHGGEWRRRRALFQWMDAMVQPPGIWMCRCV